MSLTAGFYKCLTRWVGGISAVPGVSLDGFMSLAVLLFFEGVSQGGLVALVCINNMFLPFLK